MVKKEGVLGDRHITFFEEERAEGTYVYCDGDWLWQENSMA